MCPSLCDNFSSWKRGSQNNVFDLFASSKCQKSYFDSPHWPLPLLACLRLSTHNCYAAPLDSFPTHFQESINLVNYWIFIAGHLCDFFVRVKLLRVRENCLAHPSRVYRLGCFRWVLIDCVPGT